MDIQSFNGKLRTFNGRYGLVDVDYSPFLNTLQYGLTHSDVYVPSQVSLMKQSSAQLPSYEYIALDNQGDYYTSEGGGSTTTIKKINKVGEIIATQSLSIPDVSIFSDGSYIYFSDALYSFSKYDKLLNKIWSHTQSGYYFNCRGAATDLYGNIYVLNTSNTKVNKLSPTGSLIWSATCSPAQCIDTDRFGNVYIGGNDPNNFKKIDASGATLIDTNITYGGVSKYTISAIDVSKVSDKVYISTWDRTSPFGGVSASIPFTQYNLDMTVSASSSVPVVSSVTGIGLKTIVSDEQGYIYFTSPISSTASYVYKYNSSMSLIATSSVIYHSSYIDAPKVIVYNR